jgi:hypothetical protein
MMLDERELSTALRRLAHRPDPPPPPIRSVLACGRAARHRRTAVRATSAIAALAAIMVAAVATGSWINPADEGGRAGGGPGGRTPAATPDLRLVNALDTTNRQPYRMRVRTHIFPAAAPVATPPPPPGSTLAEGAWDPVVRTGFLRRTAPSEYEERVLGDDRYVLLGGGWRQIHRCYAGLTLAPLAEQSNELGLTSDLAGLRAALGNGTITDDGRSGSGAATVDRYRFSYSTTVYSGRRCYAPGQPLPGDVGTPHQLAVTGTVDVTAATGRISRLAFQVPWTVGGDGVPDTPMVLSVLVEMTDHGTSVRVERPNVATTRR